MQKKRESSQKLVVVLGAGIAGTLTALKLADDQTFVYLIEKRYEVLLGTSSVTPGRMGLGFHYENLETALAYLHATIEFAKKFPISQFAIGRENPGGFLQRGRYFIVKDSLFSVERIMNTFEKIKQEYKRLVKEDPTNMIFGDPEKIFHFLDKSEYENDVDVDRVAVAIETAECLLDFPRLREHIIKELAKNPNIQTLVHHSADKFKFDSEHDQYIVTCTDHASVQQPLKTYHADFVVNATWEFVEEVTKNAGLMHGLPKDGRTNRLKVLAEVDLPESLKNKNSMFFCIGPHCMFSNIGNGIGLMSYAPNTNVKSDTNVYVPPKIELFTKEFRTEDEEEELARKLKKKQFGEKIIEGVSKYIPEMRKAKLRNLGLHFGIVKTTGKVDIYDPSSPFHSRNYSGVEPIVIGWINNSSIKLLNGLNNSMIVSKHIAEQINLIKQLPTLVAEVCKEKKSTVDCHKQKAIVKTVRQYFSHSEFFQPRPLEQMIETAIKKETISKSIREFKRDKLKGSSSKPAIPLARSASKESSDLALKKMSEIAIKKEAVAKAIANFERRKLVNVAAIANVASMPDLTVDLSENKRDSTPIRSYKNMSRSLSFVALFGPAPADKIAEKVTPSSSVTVTTAKDAVPDPKSDKFTCGT